MTPLGNVFILFLRAISAVRFSFVPLLLHKFVILITQCFVTPHRAKLFGVPTEIILAQRTVELAVAVWKRVQQFPCGAKTISWVSGSGVVDFN